MLSVAADELTGDHVGTDVTLTIGGIRTGGTITAVGQSPLPDRVVVEVDGQPFDLDGTKLVDLTVSRRQVLLPA